MSDDDIQVSKPHILTQAEKTAATWASNKQQEKMDLDKLIATATDTPRLAKQAAIDNAETDAKPSSRSSKKCPPSTPGKGSEKVKVPRRVELGPSVTPKRQAKIPKGSRAGTDTRALPISLEGKDVARATSKRSGARAGENPSHSAGSMSVARRFLPPAMDSDESEAKQDSDSECDSSLSEIDENMVGKSVEPSDQEDGDESASSQNSSDGLNGDRTTMRDALMEERASWPGDDSMDEDSEMGNITLRGPPAPKSPTSSRASSITAFTNGMDLLDIDDPEEASDSMLSQPTNTHLPQAEAIADPEEDLLIISKSRSKRRPTVVESDEDLPIAPKPVSKHRPAAKPPVSRNAASPAAQVANHRVSSQRQAPSVQQLESQSVQTTVESGSIVIVSKKTVDKGKAKQASDRQHTNKVSTSTKAVPVQPRPTAKPAYKGAQKRKEKLAKESAEWPDSPDETTHMGRNATKTSMTIGTRAKVKEVKISRMTRNQGPENTDADVDIIDTDVIDTDAINTDTIDTDTVPSASETRAWHASTTFYPGGLRKQSDPIAHLIRQNMEDVVADVLFVNAYPDKLEAAKSTTRSLLNLSKEFGLMHVYERLQHDMTYLKKFLRLSTQRASNTRGDIRAICIAQCAAHYQINMGDPQTVSGWLEKNRFIFPGGSFTKVDRSKPFQNIAVLSSLSSAIFRGATPTLAQKHADKFPTALVKGRTATMIPKVMLVLVATILHASILHTQNPDGQAFDVGDMKPIYTDLKGVLDRLEKEQPVIYRDMMVDIFKVVSGTAAPKASASNVEETYEFIDIEKMKRASTS
ncbi:hypothetical protein BD779DRAFT_1669211 [Infundibulicybe gibba]|nr:hypothetical protein BD779DRAFT_1669211 [Infundibulicybe gibba]